MYVCMCVCVCVYKYIYIFMHAIRTIGTGKTAAFAITVLSRVDSSNPVPQVYMLIYIYEDVYVFFQTISFFLVVSLLYIYIIIS